jgi:hypothetical protein
MDGDGLWLFCRLAVLQPALARPARSSTTVTRTIFGELDLSRIAVSKAACDRRGGAAEFLTTLVTRMGREGAVFDAALRLVVHDDDKLRSPAGLPAQRFVGDDHR